MIADKIGLEILGNRFQAIVDEMAQALFRTAHTVFIKETQDYGAVLVSPGGEVFAASRRYGVLMMVGMPMDDAVRATIELMEADGDKLTVRTSYNLAAFSFTMAELAVAVNKIVPVEVTYKPDHRQAIADSWPNSVDDSVARADWGWNHKFDVEKMCEVMVEQLRGKLLVNE